MTPRYLIYDIDKHQESPRFCQELQPFYFEKDSLTVIVDLHLGRRYWYGEWAPVDGFNEKPNENTDRPSVSIAPEATR